MQADEAKELAGVVAVLTGKDVPGINDSGYYFGPPDTNPDHILVPLGGRVQVRTAYTICCLYSLSPILSVA